MKLRLLLILPFFVTILSCGGNDPYFYEDDFSTVPDPMSTTGITPDTSSTGLISYELETGSSDLSVTIRDQVTVFYTGRKTNGEVFDSSYKNGQISPSTFSVANLIDGFTEGLIGMKEGGKRVIIVPPDLGYAGTANTLRNDTLIFDIELEAIIF